MNQTERTAQCFIVDREARFCEVGEVQAKVNECVRIFLFSNGDLFFTTLAFYVAEVKREMAAFVFSDEGSGKKIERCNC